MRIKTTKGGWNAGEYKDNFGDESPRVLIGDGLEPRVKYDPETNRPVSTGEIESKRGWLYYPGLGVQTVKLPADYSLSKDISDLDEVELINPEACVVNRQIYVRADGLKLK